MVLLKKRASLLISSILFGIVTLPWVKVAVAQETLQVNPSELTPAYPAAAPPTGTSESPDGRIEEVDYRVHALQPDFTGNLWVGSWRGLSRIDPNTGKILARVSLPNIASTLR